MATHRITIPDRLRGGEPRTIIWDDEAGTVAGTHYRVPEFRRVFDADKPVRIGNPGRTWDLHNPAHDPAEFLALLRQLYWPALDEPLRSTLPPVFDGVMPLPGEPGEELFGEDGRRLE